MVSGRYKILEKQKKRDDPRKTENQPDRNILAKIEYNVTGGRGFVILPSYHPLFLENPLEAWLYLAEHRNEFNAYKNGVSNPDSDIVPLTEFLTLAGIHKMRGKMLEEFGLSEEGLALEKILERLDIPKTEIEQVSDPFRTKP